MERPIINKTNVVMKYDGVSIRGADIYIGGAGGPRAHPL